MSERAGVEKEITDIKRTIAQIEKDVKQLREWVVANERGLPGMQETLRRITEEGITKARSDLIQRETDLQRLRETLAQHDKLVTILREVERKEQDIITLERQQEQTVVLLERHRTELRQLKLAYDQLIHPTVSAPCEIVLPTNLRVPLDAQKGAYVIGWDDAVGGSRPDIDLHGVGGSSSGVSRRHAVLRFINGRWNIIDLGSTNGTFLNEQAVAPNMPMALNDKTKLRLGSITLFFRHITNTTRL